MNGLESAKVVAIADPSKDLLRSLKQYTDTVATYDHHERMFDGEALDAVVIAAPTHLHVEIAEACVARKLPFLVEKPLSRTSAEARGLVGRLKETPVVNSVGYMGRQVDTFVQGKKVLASGVLGRLVHLRCSMYVAQLFKRGSGWRYDKQTSGGGVLITQNSHLLDHLHWYFGRIAWVSGQVKSWHSASVEDFAHAYIGFESGLTGFLDASWSIRHYRTPEISIDIHGEGGTLTVTDDSVRLFLDKAWGDYPAGWSTWLKPDLYRPASIDVAGTQYTHQDAEFVRAVQEGTPVSCDVPAAYHVQEVIDAVYESAEEGGQRVVLKERN